MLYKSQFMNDLARITGHLPVPTTCRRCLLTCFSIIRLNWLCNKRYKAKNKHLKQNSTKLFLFVTYSKSRVDADLQMAMSALFWSFVGVEDNTSYQINGNIIDCDTNAFVNMGAFAVCFSFRVVHLCLQSWASDRCHSQTAVCKFQLI